MPIYEYCCKNCGCRFELLQKIGEEMIPNCSNCQSSEVTRLVSRTGFQLKGTGWYVTDFKGGNNPGGSKDNRPTDSQAMVKDHNSTSTSSTAGSSDK